MPDQSTDTDLQSPYRERYEAAYRALEDIARGGPESHLTSRARRALRELAAAQDKLASDMLSEMKSRLDESQRRIDQVLTPSPGDAAPKESSEKSGESQ